MVSCTSGRANAKVDALTGPAPGVWAGELMDENGRHRQEQKEKPDARPSCLLEPFALHVR